MDDNEQTPKELDDLAGMFAGLTDGERLDRAEKMLVHVEAMNEAVQAGELEARQSAAVWLMATSFALRMVTEGRRR